MHRLFALTCLLTISAFAQDRASINGTVTDPTGALIAGAAVELKSATTGLHRATTTNQRGIYEITPLPVGTYTLTVTNPGFKPTTVNQIDLQYGETTDHRRPHGGRQHIRNGGGIGHGRGGQPHQRGGGPTWSSRRRSKRSR